MKMLISRFQIENSDLYLRLIKEGYSIFIYETVTSIIMSIKKGDISSKIYELYYSDTFEYFLIALEGLKLAVDDFEMSLPYDVSRNCRCDIDGDTQKLRNILEPHNIKFPIAQ